MRGIVAIGYRVFVDAEGFATIVPPETEFEPREGMREVFGVRNIDLRIHLQEPVSAEIELFVGGTICAHVAPKWMVVAPDGAFREVKRVEFADGTEWPAREDR